VYQAASAGKQAFGAPAEKTSGQPKTRGSMCSMKTQVGNLRG
jgi:hypothetical protein